MKNVLIIICLLFCNSSGIAQKLKAEKRVSDHSVYVKGKGFEGVIFDAAYTNKHLSIEGYKRFSPNISDIIKVENLLKEKLKDVTEKHNQKFIKEHLRDYLRQYLGLINNKNEKVVYVNFLWKESMEDNEEIIKSYPVGNVSWLKGWQIVFDGGDNFWKIKINLNTNELFDFGVNGIG